MALDLDKTNLSKIAEAGYEFELLLKGTEEPTGAFIKVRGQESPKAIAVQRKLFREQELLNIKKSRNGAAKETPTDWDALEANGVELAMSRVISWKGITKSGVEIPFAEGSQEVKDLLLEHRWIADAILVESNALENFR